MSLYQKFEKLCNCHSSFFSFFPSCHFFWTDCWKLFSQYFKISYQGNVWPRSGSFLGHIKKYFRKNCCQVAIRDSCGTWHGLCTVTSIHSIQKSTRNCQKIGNVDGSKQREIELINKKVWRKRKEKMFKTRNWLTLYVKRYKNCCWRSNFIRECIATYLHSTSINDHDEVAIRRYLPSKTNEQTKVIQEVVSPEVSKLNHVVMNQK